MSKPVVVILIFFGILALLVSLIFVYRWQGLRQQNRELQVQKEFLGAVEKVEKLFVLNNGFYPRAEDLSAQLAEHFPKYKWPEDLIYQTIEPDCDNKSLESRCLLMAVYGEERCYRSDVGEIRENDECQNPKSKPRSAGKQSPND